MKGDCGVVALGGMRDVVCVMGYGGGGAGAGAGDRCERGYGIWDLGSAIEYFLDALPLSSLFFSRKG